MSEKAKKFFNHSQSYIKNLKDLFSKVLEHNKKVDTLVGISSESFLKNNPTIFLSGNDEWQLYDVSLNQLVYNRIRKFI